MPEIRPDMSDESRCVSVHWNLPVQCVLPRGHRENWHEAWHPESGNRLRYRRSGAFASEDLHHGEWHDLQIAPPGGFCNDQYSGHYSGQSVVLCTGQYGHGWNHRAVVDGCTYSWNTRIPKGLTGDQLTRDVQQLRGMVVEAHARIAELETAPSPAEQDTLPAWLYQRFNRLAKPWESLSDDDRSKWAHEARAVRRAVARGGFKAETEAAS